jgi:hypothetical protein
MTRLAFYAGRVALLAILLGTSGSGRAYGQSSQARAKKKTGATTRRGASDSRVRLQRGIQRYEQGLFAEAVVDLEAALEAKPTPLAHFYLGRCYDVLGDVPAAVREYQAFLERPPSTMTKADVDAIVERVAALEALPSLLSVTSTPAMAAVRVDSGAAVVATPARLQLAPGKHVIEVVAAGYAVKRIEVDVPFGSSSAVAVELTPVPRQAYEPTAPEVTAVQGPKSDELPPRPTLNALRVTHAPKIDGVLDDEAWKAVRPSVPFTQKSPFGGERPSERTSMRVVYDDDALYVAFDCGQVASPVVARLSRRDRPTETDWVAIAFDSRSEGRSAFEFSVSAAGVLMDGLRYDDGKIAREWDEIWEAKTSVRELGWSAELRIPLQALRFDSSKRQSWGLQARRYVSAKQEIDEWAYVPLSAGGEVSHYGQLAGLHDVDNTSLELVPFALIQTRYQSPDAAIAHAGWQLRPSLGLDFKWRPASNLALTGTINPDFGQVEADQLILNLSTVELMFPEKRPFFLSGMDDFVTTVPIFYSRRIGRTPIAPPLRALGGGQEVLYDYPQPTPVFGALKFAGDVGRGWNVAAISALTGPNLVDVVAPDGARASRLTDPLTSYDVVRVRTAVVPHLDLGAMVTASVRAEPNQTLPGVIWPPTFLISRAIYPTVSDSASTEQQCPEGQVTPVDTRCFHDAYVGSTDFVWSSPDGDYALRGQVYGSAIEGGPARKLRDGTAIGARDTGAGGLVRLSKRGGGHWLLDATVSAHSRKLDFNDLGFMERQNDARAGAYVEYRTVDPALVFLETHSSALLYGQNNLSGLALARGVLAQESLLLTNRWNLTVGGYVNATHFDDREVGDGTALERAALLGAVQALTTDTRSDIVLTAQVAEERLSDGSNFNAQLGLIWHPWSTAELQLVPGYTYNAGEPRYAGAGGSMTDLVFGRLHAESASVTLRASYTFVPALTLQAYAQAFFATGRYYDFTHFDTLGTGPRPVIALRDLTTGGPPPISPDFERASLAINVVLRWEYRLGSTLYLLYVRSQNPNVALDPFQVPRLDPYVLRTAPAADVVMLKLAYWIG